MIHGRITAVLLAILLAPSLGRAEMITYTFSGTGSGKLGTNSFSDASFVLTAFADTTNVTHNAQLVYQVPNSSVTIFVSGLNSATFTIPTTTFDNQNNPHAGISDPHFDSPLVVADPAFAHYDLTTDFGPVTATPSILPGMPFATTAGDFSFTSISGDVFFQASTQTSAVPEPASLTMLAIGAVGLMTYAWRRRKGS
jgi:hypothetical protein